MKKITLADGTKLSAIQVNMVLDGLKDISYLDEPKEWPQVGDEYWYVSQGGEATRYCWDGDNFDINYQKQNNIYQTAKEAEMAVIRDRGMRVKNTAKNGEPFWRWSFVLNSPLPDCSWVISTLDRKFKTKKEAQAWGDEYAEYFLHFNS